MRFWLFPPSPPKGITRLEYLQVMDKVYDQIMKVDRKIVALRGRAERSYWMTKYEELVAIHMEMEWGLHPKNPEPAIFID